MSLLRPGVIKQYKPNQTFMLWVKSEVMSFNPSQVETQGVEST